MKWLIGVGIALVVLLFGAFITRGFYADSSIAITVARANGWADVKVIGRRVVFLSMRGCAADDVVGFVVRGTARDGRPVEGLVCSGFFFKNATLRF